MLRKEQKEEKEKMEKAKNLTDHKKLEGEETTNK